MELDTTYFCLNLKNKVSKAKKKIINKLRQDNGRQATGATDADRELGQFSIQYFCWTNIISAYLRKMLRKTI